MGGPARDSNPTTLEPFYTTIIYHDVPAHDASDVVKPTRTNTEPQQASTQPGDGSVKTVSPNDVDRNDPNTNVVEVPGEKVPWKDQVIGHAKNARGTLLGNKETKEQGQQILHGEISPAETHKKDQV